MRIPSTISSDGFTLIEAIVAAAILTTAIVALAHLLALGVRQSQNDRRSLITIVAAQAKLEELRGIPWTFNVEGAGLAPSPSTSLSEDTAGFVEYLDTFGSVAATDAERHAASYTRRWSVARVDALDSELLALRVCVLDRGSRAAHSDTCVATIRTRRP